MKRLVSLLFALMLLGTGCTTTYCVSDRAVVHSVVVHFPTPDTIRAVGCEGSRVLIRTTKDSTNVAELCSSKTLGLWNVDKMMIETEAPLEYIGKTYMP